MLGREGTAPAKGWRCETCSWNLESLNVGVRDTRLGRQGWPALSLPPVPRGHCLQIKQLCLWLDSL